MSYFNNLNQQQSYQGVYGASNPYGYGTSTQQYLSSNDQRMSLWMGEIEAWMEESFLKQVWQNLGYTVNVKTMRDKTTGGPAGYCFVNFTNTKDAANALATLSGTPVPGTTKKFRLNWASGGGLNDFTPEYTIFVGDLSAEVTDVGLLHFFQSYYPSVKAAKIVTDLSNGISKGYGFVTFSDVVEHQRSLNEMQGVMCGSKPIRVGVATNRSKPTAGANINLAQLLPQAGLMNPLSAPLDQTITTIFAGPLPTNITEDKIKTLFNMFGVITHIKIPPKKTSALIQFQNRQSADMAIQQMNGFLYEGAKVRIAWAKIQADQTINATSTFGIPNADKQAEREQTLDLYEKEKVVDKKKDNHLVPSCYDEPLDVNEDNLKFFEQSQESIIKRWKCSYLDQI